MTNSDFFINLFRASGIIILRYIHEYVCQLLGSIILSAFLVWGLIASLAIILLVHHYGEFEISLAIPK